MNLPLFDLSDDFRAVPEISALLDRILGMSAATFNQLSGEIYRHQPILISSVLGYQADGMPVNAVGGIRYIYSLIWLRFEGRPQVKKEKITASMLDQAAERNAAFLKYWQGEASPEALIETLQQSLSQVKEKALFAWMIHYVLQGAVFQQVEPDKKHQLIFDLKCMLDCLEDIADMRRQA